MIFRITLICALLISGAATAQLLLFNNSWNVGGGSNPPLGDGLLLTDGVSNLLLTDGVSDLCLTTSASC